MTHCSRRDILTRGGLLTLLAGCGLLSLDEARAAELAGFDAKSLGAALQAIGGTPADSKEIAISAPDIAENGAVVPIVVTSHVANTQDIYILVERNPNPLAAAFVIPDGTDAFVSTRVKMGQSSNIYAVVRANGKLFASVRETKVTLGGCGG